MILYDYEHAIGQDSHRFVEIMVNGRPKDMKDNTRLMLGGYYIADGKPLQANSDGDVMLHALTNAISGITCVNILGDVADRLCREEGIKDSREYVLLALRYLNGGQITHVSFSLEGRYPIISPYIENIRQSIANIIQISPSSIGITATSGEALTSFGRGEGIMCICSVTVRRPYASFGEHLLSANPLEL
jgi:2-C-methyl-D-erythritol 2,4-cyclodiphosphate synthase